MYKYELHLHTAEGSTCGKSTAEDMIRFYREAGYSGVVITDHFYHGNTASSRDLPWEDYIAAYAKGYENAKKAAEGTDFDVFFGVEEKGAGWDEYIVLGLPPAWYAAHPELRDLRGHPFLETVHAAGAFVIQAHPYRERAYMLDKTIWLNPEDSDAIEVRNCGNLPAFDRLAYEYSKTLSLPITGGSDNHNAKADPPKLSGIELPFRVHTEDELIDAIRTNRHSVIGLELAKSTPLTEPTFTVKRVSRRT